MRITIVIVLFILTMLDAKSQTMYCEYEVTRNQDVISNGALIEQIKLDYKGRFYFKNNKVLSFLEPLYLDRFKDGKLQINGTPDQGIVNVFFCTKPKQMLSLIDFDSLLYRSLSDGIVIPDKNYMDACEGKLTYYKIIKGYEPWVFLNETKNIQGLHCQRAKLFGPNNELIWDLWYTNDIKISGSTMAQTDLPGLMVEGIQPMAGYSYHLTSYSTEVDIPDSLFWPECFNGKFEYKGSSKSFSPKKAK